MKKSELLCKIEECNKSKDVDNLLKYQGLFLSGKYSEDEAIDISCCNLMCGVVESVKGKRLGQSLRSIVSGNNSSVYDVAKTLSSIITHLIIEAEQNNKEILTQEIVDSVDLLNQFVCGYVGKDRVVSIIESMVKENG